MRIQEQEPPLHPVEQGFNKRWEEVKHAGWETIKWGTVGAAVVGLGLTGFALATGGSLLAGMFGAGVTGAGIGIPLVGGIVGTLMAIPGVNVAAVGIGAAATALVGAVGMTGLGTWALASGAAAVPAILANILMTGAVVGGVAGAALGAVKGISGARDAADEELQDRMSEYDNRRARHQREMLKEQQVERYMQQGNMRVEQQLGQMGISANMNNALPNMKGQGGPNIAGVS